MGAVLLSKNFAQESEEKKRLTFSLTEYAACAIYMADEEGTNGGKPRVSLLSSHDGRVIVFDNGLVAQDHLPLLRSGMRCVWSSDGQTCSWIHPNGTIPTHGLLRACIITPYDVYNLPPDHPVLSETRLRSWRHHIMVHDWLMLEQELKAEGKL